MNDKEKDFIDSMFDFEFGNNEKYKNELKKAKELLNYIDSIRTHFGSKIALLGLARL